MPQADGAPSSNPSTELDTISYFDDLLAGLGITDDMLSKQRKGSSFPVNGVPMQIDNSVFEGLDHLKDGQMIPAGDGESIVLVQDPSEHFYKIYFSVNQEGKFFAFAFQPLSKEDLMKEGALEREGLMNETREVLQDFTDPDH